MAITAFLDISRTQKKESSLLISLLIAKNRETRAAEILPLRNRLKRGNSCARENPQIKNLTITA
jgi:hypothetical protein